MSSEDGRSSWFVTKPADIPTNCPDSPDLSGGTRPAKPADKLKSPRQRAGDKGSSPKPQNSAPRPRKVGRGSFLKTTLIAVIVALATGLASGLSGKLFDDVKAFTFALFNNHSWTAYTIEPNPVCDTYSFQDASKALTNTGMYEYIWSVGRIGDAWSGQSYKRRNPDASYFLSGIDRGSRSVIMYSSARNMDGLGVYVLSHYDGEFKGRDYYLGYWIGRECSIQGHPYIKCPMVVLHSDSSEHDAQGVMPHDACQLSEPPI